MWNLIVCALDHGAPDFLCIQYGVFFSVCFCSKTNFARLCGNKHHQKGNLIMKWNLTSQDMLHSLWNTHLHEACGLIIIYFLYFQEDFWLWHLALQTLPQFFQFTERVILTSRDQLHSRLLQVVVAQVQLPQVRGVGVQRWRQVSAAFLCDSTEWQPVWREGLLISSKNSIFAFSSHADKFNKDLLKVKFPPVT